jgi:purine-nucleoside phosphorylase
MIFGTGLGQAASMIEIQQAIPYETIPGFARSTALSHRGRLVCGRLNDICTIAMEGRCHLYEGYSFDEITRPVRVMRSLGVEQLIVTNASGGLNPQYRSGEIMVVSDHINLMFRSGPLVSESGKDREESTLSVAGRGMISPGRRSSVNDRSDARGYDPSLIQRALEIARQENFIAHRGVYVAVTGPNYETRAEYRFLRRIGGDAVGMSTVPEVRTAARWGMQILALSMIANVALPDAPQQVDAQDVVDCAASAEPNLRKIVLGTVGGD